MKYFKFLILWACTFLLSESFASNEMVERMCRPILDKKCTTSDCKDVNLRLVLDGMYNKCENSISDVESFKNTVDITSLKLNSDVGYLIAFSNLISRALAGKAKTDKFPNIKQDFISLSNQYNRYLKNNRTVFLSSLDFLDDKNKELKEELLEEDKASQQKVNERIAKLELMMQSEDSLFKYTETHKKFVPAIMFESNADKFKGKAFTSYECSFLKLNFDELEIKDLQKTLNYNCEK